MCRRGLHPVTFSRTAPAADTVAYLSAIRTALRRAAADAVSRCPAVRRARSAVLSDAAWSDYLLDVLSSPADEYVGYVAVCVASEAVLYRRTATVGCTSTRDALVDGLVRLSTAAQSPVEVDEMEAGRAAALNVFGRVLDALADDDDDDGSAGTRRDEIKTFLLDRLHDVWPTLVDAATVDGRHRTAVLFELMRLWKSVLAAADRSPWRYYYATLPRLERVLYRTDTDPDVWLNAVRLLGAGLRSRPRDKTGGCRRDDGAAALAERIATRVTRLLYFMGKTVKNVSGRGDTRAAAVVVQETVLLAMRSLRVLARTATATAAATTSDVIDCLDSYMKSRGLVAVDVRFSRWLVRLTCDRDDTLVECLTCALAVAPAVPPLLLDPFDAFVEFLACVSFDADVLLDFLMSDDENDFLPYALHVLKTACCDPPEFFRGCGRRLPDTMELLVRLRLKILRLHENRVFPYNIGPLAKLIERCDRSYCEFLESRRSTR